MGIETGTVLAHPIDDVFAWHERPGALRRLVPPWQPIHVLAEATNLRDGQARLRLPGGVVWVAQHGDYRPPEQFADELTSLPLRWRHVHRFEPTSDGGTRVIDRVDTPVPGRLLRSTFAYRHRQLADDLQAGITARHWSEHRLTVAVTGSSGLVGSALVALLGVCGHRVVRLVRNGGGDGTRQWHPDSPDPAILDGVDAVVHLAGASIAGRFTDAHKRKLADSRIGPTEKLARRAAEAGVRTFVCASAIGYYGPDRGEENLSEDADRGEGFLAELVQEWEAATAPAAHAGVRVVNVRTGIVQSPRGGSLRLLRPLFAAGLGGRLGDGQQWNSWIDLDDLGDVYLRALLDERLSGPVNAVAPDPVRNQDYTRVLGHVLRRPTVLPVPDIGPTVLLGAEGADELALASQRVTPTRLLELGHDFRRPNLEDCLRHQLGRARRDVWRRGESNP